MNRSGSVSGWGTESEVGTIGQALDIHGVEISVGHAVLGNRCVEVTGNDCRIVNRGDGDLEQGGGRSLQVVGHGNLESIVSEVVRIGGVCPVP